MRKNELEKWVNEITDLLIPLSECLIAYHHPFAQNPHVIFDQLRTQLVSFKSYLLKYEKYQIIEIENEKELNRLRNDFKGEK